MLDKKCLDVYQHQFLPNDCENSSMSWNLHAFKVRREMVKVKIHPKMKIIPYVVVNWHDFLFP